VAATTTFFAKLLMLISNLTNALAKENITAFSSHPTLANVARFVYFRNDSGRKSGVWVVRQGELHFALPFVNRAARSYLRLRAGSSRAPGLRRRRWRNTIPCLVPFLDLEDGTTIAAADGADEIHPSRMGKCYAAWKRWVVVGAKAGETIDPRSRDGSHLVAHKNGLRRSEVITPFKSVMIRRLWMAVPTRRIVSRRPS